VLSDELHWYFGSARMTSSSVYPNFVLILISELHRAFVIQLILFSLKKSDIAKSLSKLLCYQFLDVKNGFISYFFNNSEKKGLRFIEKNRV
jgi:hypothetical protein